MEADWSVEIGPGLPRIDGFWESWVDLRDDPLAIEKVEEAVEHPAMGEALLTLNGGKSSVFTTKCDVWVLGEQEIDPFEFGATPETVRKGFASYIDVLESDSVQFASFAFHEERARGLASHLRAIDLRQGRVDVVLRAAEVRGLQGYGLTVYSAGCGGSEAEAYTSWRAVLVTTVAATIAAARASSSIG
jgi:hypothetical protein